MKVSITGASAFVNRMFEACGPYQWAREFLKNSLEANASRIEFGIEWQAVEQHGVYRRTIIDNGTGMSSKELLDFFSTLGAGAKEIGGLHQNFGVGAKIAALPWNPEGMVVISYKDGKASMIWIILEPDSGDYELVEFLTPTGNTCVVDPSTIDWRDDGQVDWSAVKPEWLHDHGTVIVLLGSEEYPDTVLGNPPAGESKIKGISVYLNTRFWDLSDKEITVVELRSEKKNSWPTGRDDRDDARRPNNRRIMGAKHYLTDLKADRARLCASDVKLIDEDRVAVEWYLWEGQRPSVHGYAQEGGYIAVRYQGELYQATNHKAHFRWFGIIESAVQQNLTLIIEPQLYERKAARWGVHPDQSRNRLIFTGNGQKGVDLPLPDWGVAFAEEMPKPIEEAIRKARGNVDASIDNDDYRKRLQDKFGNRWKIKQWVAAPRKTRKTESGRPEADAEDVEVYPPEKEGEAGPHRRRKKSVLIVRSKAIPGDAGEMIEAETPVDVPRYRYGRKEDFEQRWHLAMWAPTDTAGPHVIINIESPILQEIVKYHQDQYPDVFAEEVQRTVQEVFGEVAACKVAHSQKLMREGLTEQELDASYRDEKALTVALMGLMAEESLIAQRLGKLGRKKAMA